jgi:DNA-directed RNA polymerase subunit RPC12/RpoP
VRKISPKEAKHEKATGRFGRLLLQLNLLAKTFMSELKFNCSHCGQHLQCEEQYRGRQISCPKCHAMTVVPSIPQKVAPAGARSGMTFVPESWQTPPSPPPPTAE